MNDLVAAAQSGDRKALSELLMDNRSVIAAAVSRVAWDRDRVPDIVQSALVRAVKSIRQFSHRCAFSTWLYRIAVNESIESNRRSARARRTEVQSDQLELFADLNASDGLAAAEMSEVMSAVREEVASLSLSHRTAFSLFYFGGYTGAEAAESLGITEANFFMRLKAARDSVREGLRRRGWEL
jgi:RNA polymerase sigma-70 factor (ECF subfamily)